MAEERIQKILARAGIASRRAAEELMLSGKVIVNGQKVTELGTKADPDQDDIRVKGRSIAPLLRQPRHYFLCFKPRNMITSLSDPEGRPTLADLLHSHGIRHRVYPVGRLDWDADGLLLLTDDGDLANQVMHPKGHLPKLYRVKVKGWPDERVLDKVRRGVMIEPGIRTLPARVEIESADEDCSWLSVALTEGRQNQIKRMFELVGHPVRRIRRLAIGPLRLGRMKVGDVREMTERDVIKLRRALTAAAQGEDPEAILGPEHPAPPVRPRKPRAGGRRGSGRGGTKTEGRVRGAERRGGPSGGDRPRGGGAARGPGARTPSGGSGGGRPRRRS